MLLTTQQYMDNTPIEHRKALGQYFTPPEVRDILFSVLPAQGNNPKIGELSVGTGEFIQDIYKHYPTADVHAYDIDPNVLSIAKTIDTRPHYYLGNALYATDIGFDYIIGNPPYFEIKKADVPKHLKHIVSGRPNIYGLFIYQALTMLKPGGYLAFVVPTSMNNGAYFKKLRQEITSLASVEHIIRLGDTRFDDALQSAQILILRRSGDYTDKHIVLINKHIVFSECANELRTLLAGSTTLKELGFRVKTGSIVWNQYRSYLHKYGGIPLIWSSNIKSGAVILDRTKDQYIANIQPEYNEGIVVNRITGSNHNTIIRAGYYKGQFLAENHVNVITGYNNTLPLQELLPHILNTKALQVMRLLVGNTQISKTELEEIFPIWL